MFAERRQYIQNNIDESQSNLENASGDRQNANTELINARLSASQIISDAKVQSENIKALTIDKAKDEANEILNEAKNEIQMQRAKLESDAKVQIISVALAAAQKIIEKEVDKESNRRLIQDFIKAND
jgi:F-type H+-transporting ATPase subunit b